MSVDGAGGRFDNGASGAQSAFKEKFFRGQTGRKFFGTMPDGQVLAVLDKPPHGDNPDFTVVVGMLDTSSPQAKETVVEIPEIMFERYRNGDAQSALPYFSNLLPGGAEPSSLGALSVEEIATRVRADFDHLGEPVPEDAKLIPLAEFIKMTGGMTLSGRGEDTLYVTLGNRAAISDA